MVYATQPSATILDEATPQGSNDEKTTDESWWWAITARVVEAFWALFPWSTSVSHHHGADGDQ